MPQMKSTQSVTLPFGCLAAVKNDFNDVYVEFHRTHLAMSDAYGVVVEVPVENMHVNGLGAIEWTMYPVVGDQTDEVNCCWVQGSAWVDVRHYAVEEGALYTFFMQLAHFARRIARIECAPHVGLTLHQERSPMFRAPHPDAPEYGKCIGEPVEQEASPDFHSIPDCGE